jgi:hypothetical protein
VFVDYVGYIKKAMWLLWKFRHMTRVQLNLQLEPEPEPEVIQIEEEEEEAPIGKWIFERFLLL